MAHLSEQPVFMHIVRITNAKNYRFLNIAKLSLSLNTRILLMMAAFLVYGKNCDSPTFIWSFFVSMMIIVNVLLEVYLQ